LAALSLDATHIVMVYEQNMNNRKTAGSRWLAAVMNKFRRVDTDRCAAAWGAMFTGEVAAADARDAAMRQTLLDQSMDLLQAKKVLSSIDVETPWLTELRFIQALAAICSVFSEEVSKVSFSGATLHPLLCNLAGPAKCQWLLNDTRYRHTVRPERLPLLPSGTTSNESLHHEINYWFRETATWLNMHSVRDSHCCKSREGVHLNIEQCVAYVRSACTDRRSTASSTFYSL
jgi:hypothetical protein